MAKCYSRATGQLEGQDFGQDLCPEPFCRTKATADPGTSGAAATEAKAKARV